MRPRVRVGDKTTSCYVCGPENPRGLHVPFVRAAPAGSRAEYVARSEHAGWPDVLHGGVTFSLMDEALGWAVYFEGLRGLTARADVRFHRPIRIGSRVIVRGAILERHRRLVRTRATIHLDRDEGVLLASIDATKFLADVHDDE
jgi:acyl-coenzyme A thioesterase PaaI-like protein